MPFTPSDNSGFARGENGDEIVLSAYGDEAGVGGPCDLITVIRSGMSASCRCTHAVEGTEITSEGICQSTKGQASLLHQASTYRSSCTSISRSIPSSETVARIRPSGEYANAALSSASSA